MTRDEVFAIIQQSYHIEPEFLWARTPNSAIWRHPDNRKWFAIIMDFRARHLDGHITEQDLNKVIDVVNVKIDPEAGEELLQQPGIYPAFHMNKIHWISLRLDEISPDLFQALLARSYELTA